MRVKRNCGQRGGGGMEWTEEGEGKGRCSVGH